MRSLLFTLLLTVSSFAADLVLPKFEAQVIDSKVEIGYATAVADIDGDGKPDILLVDTKQICWYHNPDWSKHVIAENVSHVGENGKRLDNVCIAVKDIDGSGKASIAIGAEWLPSDTVNSGSVHYLIPPADRTQKWEVVTLPHEPTVHRMKWVQFADLKYRLVVAPLHGRGNKNNAGENGSKILAYTIPANPKDEWKMEVVDDSMHLTHNFDLVSWYRMPGQQIIIAGKENILFCGGGQKTPLISTGEQGFDGAGEVRAGKGPDGGQFLATVEPFHGTKAAIYTPPPRGEVKLWTRRVIEEGLKDGHAVACADLCGLGYDQVLVGWRLPNPAGKVGINMYLPPAQADGEWKKVVVDDNTMACEDLVVADLNGDGRLDIVASGRATHNLVIYWNKK